MHKTKLIKRNKRRKQKKTNNTFFVLIETTLFELRISLVVSAHEATNKNESINISDASATKYKAIMGMKPIQGCVNGYYFRHGTKTILRAYWSRRACNILYYYGILYVDRELLLSYKVKTIDMTNSIN